MNERVRERGGFRAFPDLIPVVGLATYSIRDGLMIGMVGKERLGIILKKLKRDTLLSGYHALTTSILVEGTALIATGQLVKFH